MMDKKYSPAQVFGLLTFTAFLWGGNAVAVKKVLTEISPFLLTMLRFAVFSSILLLAVGYQEGRRFLPQRRHLHRSDPPSRGAGSIRSGL